MAPVVAPPIFHVPLVRLIVPDPVIGALQLLGPVPPLFTRLPVFTNAPLPLTGESASTFHTPALLMVPATLNTFATDGGFRFTVPWLLTIPVLITCAVVLLAVICAVAPLAMVRVAPMPPPVQFSMLVTVTLPEPPKLPKMRFKFAICTVPVNDTCPKVSTWVRTLKV